LKIMIGDESIRQEILMHYNPSLHKGNITKLKAIGKIKNHIFTFNAFVEPGKTREDKMDEIRNYLEKIANMQGTIVFTATNIQQDENDFETHFQSFIVDNDVKKITIIDPAYDKTVTVDKKKKKNKILFDGQGIYYAEVAHDVVKPFFQMHKNGYTVEFIKLTNPAQIATDDVFCQSWSLFILNSLLKDNSYKTVTEFEIPDKQIDKYDMILKFYKRIFADIPNLRKYLKFEYEGEIVAEYDDDCVLLNANPQKVFMSMTKNDMKA